MYNLLLRSLYFFFPETPGITTIIAALIQRTVALSGY